MPMDDCRSPCIALLVAAALLLVCAGAEDSVVVTPSVIKAAELHQQQAGAASGEVRLVNITFLATDPDSVDYVNFEGLSFPLDFEVRMSVIERRDFVLPYGFGNLQDEICPPRQKDKRGCIYAAGKRTAMIELTQAAVFDLKEEQVVEVIFSHKLFNPARTSSFTTSFVIVPEAKDPRVEAYAITLPLLLVDVITAFVMPTTQDITTAVLMPHMTCATNEERGWYLFSATDVYLPFPGLDVFTRAVLVLVLVGVVVVSCFVVLRLMVRFDTSASKIHSFQALFPLLLAQVWFYFSQRGLSFAAGQLMGAWYPRYQVFGAFIQIILIFSFIGARQMLLCDPRWEWCRAEKPPVRLGLAARFRYFQGFKGFWFFNYGADNSPEKRWASTVFPREFDAGVRLRLVLPMMWLLNSIEVTILSGSPQTPSSCFTHYVGTGILHIAVTLFIIRVRAFRSYILVAFTVAIRCATATALFLLSSGPGSSGSVREVGYFLCTGIILALAVVRLVWWAVMVSSQAAPEVQRPVLKSTFEVPMLDPSLEQDGVHADSTDASSPAGGADKKVTFSAESPKEARPAPVAVAVPPLDAGPSSAERDKDQLMGELTNSSILSGVSMATSFGGSSVGGAKEPRWLQDSQKHRVKAQPEDVFKDQQPKWFPQERPQVRSDNVGDAPLKYSPYIVRKGGRKAGEN